MADDRNPDFSSLKRKLDEDNADSSSDEESLFLPQARLVLMQSKKTKEPPKITEDSLPDSNDGAGHEEEDSEEWLTDEEDSDPADAGGDDKSEASEEENVEDEDVPETLGDTIEDLGAGREEKEDDELIVAMSKAAKPQERNKPKDIKSKFMVTDISFHPREELIGISNIEGEIVV